MFVFVCFHLSIHVMLVCCMCSCDMIFFFFFKQKTAYEMRISDWSSDVCSSDLVCRSGRIDGRDGDLRDRRGWPGCRGSEGGDGAGGDCGVSGALVRLAREGDRKSTRLNSSH